MTRKGGKKHTKKGGMFGKALLPLSLVMLNRHLGKRMIARKTKKGRK
jgi:hypothetical protein